MNHFDRKRYAVLVLCTGIGFASIQDVFMKYLSGAYPFHELQAIRCVIALALVVVVVLFQQGASAYRGSFQMALIWRGLLLGSGSAFFYLSLPAMTLADATAIYFALPLIVAILSGLVVGEKVQSWRWLAALFGFVGVALAIKPTSALFEPASILTLIATFLYALGNLFTRRIDRRIPPLVVASYTGLGFILIAAVLAAVFGSGSYYEASSPSYGFLTRPWVMPSLRDWGYIGGFGISTAIGFFTFAEAYRSAPPSFVAPFEYSSMVWAIGLGYLFFGDVPAFTTLIGSAIIIAAGLLLGWWEHRRDRHLLLR